MMQDVLIIRQTPNRDNMAEQSSSSKLILIRQLFTTQSSQLIGSADRENKPRKSVKTLADQEIGKTDNDEVEKQPFKCFLHSLQKVRPHCFRLLVDQKEGEQSMIRAEYQTIRLEPFSRRQPNQCCGLQIRRNLIPRGLDDRRSPLQCARRTNVATALRCHIPCNPKHRMVFKLFDRNERHNPTRQRVGVCNHRNRRGSNSIIKW